MPPPSPALPVRQVGAALDRHPTDRLIVFVPRWQLGAALHQAVVQERGGAAGLTVTSIDSYAQNLVQLSLRAQGGSELDAGTHFFLTSQAIRQLPSDKQSDLSGGQPLSGMIAPLARTFATLRDHNISPTTYRQRAGETARRQAQADAFARYEALLHDRNFYDTAERLRAATEQVDSGTLDLSATVYAIEDTVTLSTAEERFVSTLREAVETAPGLYRIGPSSTENARAPNSVAPPPRTAASHFPEAPRPNPQSASPSAIGTVALHSGASYQPDPASPLRFWTAAGTRREVQAVFDDILEQGHPLDTVEIAYTSPAPYLPLIDTLAERYGIPVSLSGGRSLDATRPGQALRGFFDWVANGCPIPDLIALLRAGLLDPGVSTADATGTLDSRRAATLLAEKRYPDNCRDYSDTFDAWLDSLASEAKNLETNAEGNWTESPLRELRQKRTAVRALKRTINRLLALGHMNDRSPVSPSELAAGSETLLEEFGPTEAPGEDEEERTPDQAARNRLIERLQRLQELDQDLSLPAPQMAGQMKTWLGLSPFVQAQQPRAGRAHVVPLESAGYANRDHLYVVGLDAASTQSAVSDDPLLSDAERDTLSDDTRALPLRSHQSDLEAWRTRQALARHEGPVTLSASTYDLREGEDRFEAPLYLQLKEAAQSARNEANDTDAELVTHHSLAPSASTHLSTLDRWTSRARPSADALEEALETHPWIQQGLAAAAARNADTYTSHDGLLSPRAYASLNPLSGTRPVSAGRLETYAQAPYAYFLRHILDVAPLDEPALDDVAWLDARSRGAVLHDTFKRFMDRLDRQPTREDRDQLRTVFETVIDEKRATLPPPSEVVFASTRRQLWNDARLFLRAEAARTDAHRPYDFELGFGYPPHRQKESDHGDAPTLELGDHAFPLRGRIDRIDKLEDGTFGLWDYKTGSAGGYDESDLVGDFHLQWALYAYAYETLEDVTVTTAGYFFTSTDEMGKRIAAPPGAHREAVARVLDQVADGVTAGAFPMTDADALRYNYDRLFHDYGNRRKQLNAKRWPEDRPPPPCLHED